MFDLAGGLFAFISNNRILSAYFKGLGLFAKCKKSALLFCIVDKNYNMYNFESDIKFLTFESIKIQLAFMSFTSFWSAVLCSY